MKWIEVDSSAISALAYDAGRRCLGIEFRDKQQVYFYYEVPPSEFQAFRSTESMGRYLTLAFLPKNYRCAGPLPRRRSVA